MLSVIQVAMCNFQTIKDAADVAIATMLSGIQVCPFPSVFLIAMTIHVFLGKVVYERIDILCSIRTEYACLHAHVCSCDINCLLQIEWLPVVVFDILLGLLYVLG